MFLRVEKGSLGTNMLKTKKKKKKKKIRTPGQAKVRLVLLTLFQCALLIPLKKIRKPNEGSKGKIGKKRFKKITTFNIIENQIII